MKVRYLLLNIVVLFITYEFYCQVGIGTTSPDPSSILQVQANNKGFLLPRLSASQRLAINPAANGLMVYDIDSSSLFIYNSATSSWKRLKAISSLNDIVTGNSSGDLLVWN